MSSKKQTIEQLAATVSDSTDFPDIATAPGLRTLDSALRCPICCELFSGPVTLRCGHCFCSLCIRGSLAQKQECPSCRKGEENEGHLRVNPVVEEAVEAWSKARPFILQLLHRGGRPSVNSNPSESGPSKKRKRSSPDSDIEFVAGPSGQKTGIASGTVFSESRELTLAEASPAETPCPVCGKTVKLEIINQHLDSGCKTFGFNNSSKTAWSKLMTPRVNPEKSKQNQAKGKERSLSVEDEALPKVSYDTLKDKQIKGLLQDQGLPTSGDRALWIIRHQKWVMLWNSNLDKAPKNRKSPSQLKSELSRWLEDNQSKSKLVVEDTHRHQKKYESEFKRLTEVARPKKAVSSQLSDSMKATSLEVESTDPTNPSTSGPRKSLSQSPLHNSDGDEIDVL